MMVFGVAFLSLCLSMVLIYGGSMDFHLISSPSHSELMSILKGQVLDRLNFLKKNDEGDIEINTIIDAISFCSVFWSDIWERVPFKISLSHGAQKDALFDYSFQQEVDLFRHYNLSLTTNISIM